MEAMLQAAVQWAESHNVILTEYEGEPFAIVQNWATLSGEQGKYDPSPLWTENMLALGIDPEDGWGFADEWTTCDYCNAAIKTSPDSYGWAPDFWVSTDGIVCAACLRNAAVQEDYIAWYQAEALEGQYHHWVLPDPPDSFGFRQVLVGLENGLHEGQNDDPRKIVPWLIERGLEVAVVLLPGQFDVQFDVWARHVGEALEQQELSDEEVAAIRDAILQPGYGSVSHDTLRSAFQEWPTPAARMQEALKNPTEVHVSKEDFVAGRALDVARAQAPDAVVRSIVVEEG